MTNFKIRRNQIKKKMKEDRKVGQLKRQEAGVMERVKKIGDHGKRE